MILETLFLVCDKIMLYFSLNFLKQGIANGPPEFGCVRLNSTGLGKKTMNSVDSGYEKYDELLKQLWCECHQVRGDGLELQGPENIRAKLF